jgi:hypothetical protein
MLQHQPCRCLLSMSQRDPMGTDGRWMRNSGKTAGPERSAERNRQGRQSRDPGMTTRISLCGAAIASEIDGRFQMSPKCRLVPFAARRNDRTIAVSIPWRANARPLGKFIEAILSGVTFRRRFRGHFIVPPYKSTNGGLKFILAGPGRVSAQRGCREHLRPSPSPHSF